MDTEKCFDVHGGAVLHWKTFLNCQIPGVKTNTDYDVISQISFLPHMDPYSAGICFCRPK